MLRRLAGLRPVRWKSTIPVSFVDKTKNLTTVNAEVGSTLLETAHRHGVPIEGACEGVCACSTCHVYVHPDFLPRFPAPSEEEEDVSQLRRGSVYWLCLTLPLRRCLTRPSL